MGFKIRWMGTACFEIRLEGETTIVIDPYVDDSVSVPFASDLIEGCDYIFITHGHYDHVLDVGKLVQRFNPEIFCSQEVAGALSQHQNIGPERFTHITVGDFIERDQVRAEVLRGVHVDFVAMYQRITGGDLFEDAGGDFEKGVRMALEASMGSKVAPPDHMREWMLKYPQGEQLNFVLEVDGGKRIYMAGSYPDASLMEVAKNTRAYMTLLQVLTGNTLKGLEEQTVEFGLASGAEIIVPQHHDPLMEGAQPADLGKIRELIEKHNVRFEEFTPGHWYQFG
jgi:L-ascorbate metabolism protein UlaG (beta-lactamase superfamily)